jgi:hypothetical protein
MRLTDEPTGIVVFSHDDRAVAQPLALPQVSGPHPTIVHHSSQFRQILASVDPFTAGRRDTGFWSIAPTFIGRSAVQRLLRMYRGSYNSSTIVTGPSLTSSTTMRAPKMPVCTGTPRSRSASQKDS